MDKFYNEDFEKYLREQADQFKLQPSKKTWHGIYNNFHPGRRWPSVATGLMIIILLTLTNTLNTRQQAELLEAYKTSGTSAAVVNKSIKLSQKRNSTSIDDIWEKNMVSDLFSISSFEKTSQSESVTANSDKQQTVNGFQNQVAQITSIGDFNSNNEINLNQNKISSVKSSPEKSDLNYVTNFNDNTDPISLPTTKIINHFPTSDIIKADKIPNNKSIKLTNNKNQSLSNLIKKFRRSRANWSLYITPTINYRKISNNISSSIEIPGATYLTTNNDVNNSPSHHAAPGIEIGTNISIPLLKKLQFFTGFQLNYSGYNITASNSHPVLSSLVIVQNGSAQTQEAISYYSTDDNGSMVTLHNYNVEAGIPLGLKYKLLDNQRFYVNIMSSVIPSVNLFERSYLLSSDSHNYVTYPDLQRNFNINSEFGASIGFKLSKLKYELGPDFRYQIMSNFKKSSPYSEHLVNYGVRFTISN